jgi:hypothetical protein
LKPLTANDDNLLKMDETQTRANRYAACDPAVRAWATTQGYEHLKGRVESGNAIANQAVTTLTILLAGIGASMAYAAKVFAPQPDGLARGAAFLCAYLCVLAALLVIKCINLGAAPTLYNEPDKLLLPGSLEALSIGELANLQGRIDQMKRRNSDRARWLNGLRLFAIAGPLVFALAALY